MPIVTDSVSTLLPVTRGEDSALLTDTQNVPPKTMKGDGVRHAMREAYGDFRTHIDWVNFVIPAMNTTVEAVTCILARAMPHAALIVEKKGGRFGYTDCHVIRTIVAGKYAEIGSISLGGTSQRGTCLVIITGKGCALVWDWASLVKGLAHLCPKISRIDIACDFPYGEYTFDQSLLMLKSGKFNVKGRQPKSRVDGDWIDGIRGRTLYIGISGNGKMLRVYERGIMLGDIGSPWIRYEVQFTNRDRVIPLVALCNPDPYFAGAYPALTEMLLVAAIPISTKRKVANLSLSHKLHHLKLSYGATIAEAMATTGASEQSLVSLVSAAPELLSQREFQLDWDVIKSQLNK